MPENQTGKPRPWWWEVNDWRKKSGLTFSFIAFTILNATLMYFGIEALDKCPVQPMIPIFLIVAGSTSLSLLLVRLVVSHLLLPALEKKGLIQETSFEDPNPGKSLLALNLFFNALSVYDTLASVFSTAWLIAGSVYVYGTKPEFIDPDYIGYCDYTTYVFAFVVITIGYVSLGLSILVALIHCFCKNI